MDTATNSTLTSLSLDKMAAISHATIMKTFFISIGISLKFVPKSPIDNRTVLVQGMAWHWRCDKPFPEPMLTQITATYMWQ